MKETRFNIPLSNSHSGAIASLSTGFSIAAALSSEINLSLFNNDWISYPIAVYLSVIIVISSAAFIIRYMVEKKNAGYIKDDDIASEVIGAIISFFITTLPVTSALWQ